MYTFCNKFCLEAIFWLQFRLKCHSLNKLSCELLKVIFDFLMHLKCRFWWGQNRYFYKKKLQIDKYFIVVYNEFLHTILFTKYHSLFFIVAILNSNVSFDEKRHNFCLSLRTCYGAAHKLLFFTFIFLNPILFESIE